MPFERIPELKAVIERRRSWQAIDDEWGCFEWTWRPNRKSKRRFNCVLFRHLVRKPEKGPIRLDMFRQVQREHEYKVVLTNRVADPATILAFHNGRGAQAETFAELKTDLPMGYLPSRRQVGNQVWLLSAVLAHALARELQMAATPPRHERNTPAREPLWLIERVDTLRKWWIQRAASITRHADRLVITFAKGGDTESEIRRLLEPWGRAAA